MYSTSIHNWSWDNSKHRMLSKCPSRPLQWNGSWKNEPWMTSSDFWLFRITTRIKFLHYRRAWGSVTEQGHLTEYVHGTNSKHVHELQTTAVTCKTTTCMVAKSESPHKTGKHPTIQHRVLPWITCKQQLSEMAAYHKKCNHISSNQLGAGCKNRSQQVWQNRIKIKTKIK